MGLRISLKKTTKKMVHDLLKGAEVLNKSGESVDHSTLSGKQIVCFYFSAHWCPPCRGFTPVLCEFYNTCVADGKSLEIIFVTSDQDEASFKDCWSNMPWLAIKFGDAQIQNLKQHFGVTGIPMLAVCKGDGTQVVQNGRG